MDSRPSELFLELLGEVRFHPALPPGFKDRLSFETTPKVTRLFHRLSLAVDGGRGLDMETFTGDGCNTTHCIAGWVVDIAGQGGGDLSDVIGTTEASDLIMAASCPWLERLPNYYSDDETAMKFIESAVKREHAEL